MWRHAKAPFNQQPGVIKFNLKYSLRFAPEQMAELRRVLGGISSSSISLWRQLWTQLTLQDVPIMEDVNIRCLYCGGMSKLRISYGGIGIGVTKLLAFPLTQHHPLVVFTRYSINCDFLMLVKNSPAFSHKLGVIDSIVSSAVQRQLPTSIILFPS